MIDEKSFDSAKNKIYEIQPSCGGAHDEKWNNIRRMKLKIIDEALNSKFKSPISSSDVTKYTYSELISLLESVGFRDISTEKIEDIVLGIFAKENYVKKVSIDGKYDFTAEEVFYPSSTVVIYYHSKKN